ncbi:hypothetical protein CHUAL_005528 [Chamberlinius hualienensis]
MFYAHFVLSKKGPLARIWLAAHWDKKLTKAHVFETNIESSVEGILQPKVKMALRTSGHLLLGVVRIYSRKAKYLLADCNEAFIKIKMAFRPGVVDLPEESREAALNAITLPEVFHDFDSAMPELNDIDIQPQLNQSRIEDITIHEEYGITPIMGDDGFGDTGFEIDREDINMGDSMGVSHSFGNEKRNKDDRNRLSDIDKGSSMDIDAPLSNDGFGGDVGDGMLSGGLFEPGELFGDNNMGHVTMDISGTKSVKQSIATDNKQNESDDDDSYYGDMGPPSAGAPSSGRSSPMSPAPAKSNLDELNEDQPADTNNMQPQPDQTTLVPNEEEAFALAPLETTVFQGVERGKSKRKRKLIIDEVKNISGEEMKSQLADTTDIVTTLDLAPPTKRLMHWKETGGVEKLFALPSRHIQSKSLSKLYQRHLTTRAVENENIGLLPTEEDKAEVIEPNREEQAIKITHPAHKRHGSVAVEEPEVERLQTTEERLDLSRVLPEPDLLDLPNGSQSLVMDASIPVQQVPQQISPIPPPQTPQPVVPTPPPPPQPPLYQSPLHSPHFHHQQIPTSRLPAEPESLSNTDMQQMNQDLHASVAIEDTFSNITQLEPPTTLPHSDILQSHDDFFSQSTVSHNINQTMDHLQHQEPPLPYHDDEEDDFGCPVSVGPPEEQGADETYEQFEERILNKRAQQMLYVVQRQFSRQNHVRFNELARNCTRKQVAQKFYTLLVLKKQQAVELEQQVAFGELIITRGPKLNMMY